MRTRTLEKTIKLRFAVWKRLTDIKMPNESYANLIEFLIDEYEKGKDEVIK
jgi:hypothetical protein